MKRNHGVPIARAMPSVNRPNTSRLPPRKGTKLVRSPFGLSRRVSLRTARAIGCPPSADRDSRRTRAHGFRFIVGRRTSPVVGEQIVEDVINGHHPDKSVVLV